MMTQLRSVGFAVCATVAISMMCAGTSAAPQKAQAESAVAKQAQSQKPLRATSAGVDALNKTYIVLYWPATEGVVGYNLYRKDTSAAGYSAAPLNGTKPIAMVKTCAELQAIIAEDSPEWQMLTDAFSSLGVKQKSEPAALQIHPNAPKGNTFPEQGIESAQPAPKVKASSAASLSKAVVSHAGLLLLAQNPCSVIARGLTEAEQAYFDVMANANLKIRMARGLAYIDKNVVVNSSYLYELRGVKSDGTEVSIAKDVPVKAGHFTLPNPPAGIKAAAGDAQVLATWSRNTNASTYLVGRATTPSGPFVQVSTEPVLFDIDTDLAGEAITPTPGLVDFQRWGDDGLAIPHDVTTTSGATVSVSGPENGTTYYYSVASMDILGRPGAWSSSPASAKPMDSTDPGAPSDVKVDPSTAPVGLAVGWRKVTLDVKGHQELGTTQTYNIYRADNLQALENVAALTPSSGMFVKSVTANPTDPTTPTLSWTDTDPNLVPPYGEKDFYYRIQCVDARNNTSGPSAIISGRAPDITPPGPTKVTGSEGHADHIHITWEPNNEPDLAGYQIWVGVCDKGKPYRPHKGQSDENRYPCEFSLVAEMQKSEADERREKTGKIYFDDYSQPAGSPICYAYWVRAFDVARNVYTGKNKSGCPEPGEYVCQRLYEETPPPPPVLSGMQARNGRVMLEWMSSPVQDLCAFHVYRSENEDDTPKFVACVMLDGTVSNTKWAGIKAQCDDIPAEPYPLAVKGSYVDKGLAPNAIYYYRVAAVDWLGNESEAADIRKIPASSTFTYSKDLPGTPVVLAGKTAPDGCGFIVRWTPTFDAAALSGFLVYRAVAKAGPFRQVSSIVTANEFIDKTAIKGLEAWYRVQAIDKLGKLSEPSAAVLYK